jgi:hypothetical protein
LLLAAVKVDFPSLVSLPTLQIMASAPSRLPEIARPKSNLPDDNQTEKDADQ